MADFTSLVVVYSRTGYTRTVAQAIAEELGCDLEEIRDTKDRDGVTGYFGSGKDALLKKEAEIEPPEHDAGDYDLVVMGTPVWAATISSPVRAYLANHLPDGPELGFFLTTGGTGIDRTFRHMREMTGKDPLATLGLKIGRAHV